MYVKQACPNKGPKRASYIEIRKFIIKTVPLPKAKHLTKLKKKNNPIPNFSSYPYTCIGTSLSEM